MASWYMLIINAYAALCVSSHTCVSSVCVCVVIMIGNRYHLCHLSCMLSYTTTCIVLPYTRIPNQCIHHLLSTHSPVRICASTYYHLCYQCCALLHIVIVIINSCRVGRFVYTMHMRTSRVWVCVRLTVDKPRERWLQKHAICVYHNNTNKTITWYQ